MKNLFLRTLVIGLFLLVIPVKQYGQNPQFTHSQPTLDFDITEISLFDERIFFMYNLVNDGRFDVVNSENDGVFIISVDPAYKDMDLKSAFAEFREQNAIEFSRMDKEEAAETSIAYKAALPQEITLSLMMDVYAKSRQNNHCADADPFCTDNGMYQFPAGVNAGSGEPGPNYDCLHTTPNPAWYYMRIGTPGNINIYMYSTPSEDIDFCCWGPFDDPVSPCPGGLTINKRVSCSYSSAPTETCQIPSSAQTGQYYILVITNFSNHTCNINFSKTSGSGTTDCGILPPLVDPGGPYCVGETITLSGNAQQGATYTWSGPGGWTASGHTVTRPNCTMAMAGTYTCTITLNGQTNSAPAEVQVYPKPTANFTATSVCKGENTQFTNSSTSNPSNQNMSYLWDFGDGQTSNQTSPSHPYAEAGNYTVTLTASCGNGTCTSTKTQNVIVYQTPVASATATNSVVQYGGTTQLHGSGGTGSFNYHWEPANKLVNANLQNPQTIGLTESTTFTVTVTQPQGGCSSTAQVIVSVQGSNMTASASATPSSICRGETTQLNAIAVGGNANNYSYSWSPSTGLSNPLIASPTASPVTTTTYTCNVSDGYTNQQVSTTVTVNQPEYTEVTQYICPGDSYNFYGTEYSDVGDYDYNTTTSQGCEKVITLHLRHYPSYDNAHTTTEYICPGYSFNFHGQYFNTTGLHPVNLHTTHGCDSIVWLDLTVYPPNDTTIVDPTICTSQTYNFHGVEYNHDGDIAYFDTIDNHGCLKVEKLVLSVGPYQMPPVQNQYECYTYDGSPSYYWDKTGQTYTEDTYDEIILPDPQGGCDIKYRLNLKFHQEFYHHETLTQCDEYVWPVNGQRYTTTNHNIRASFDSYIGNNSQYVCDSTFVLDLTVNYTDYDTIEVRNQCDQYSWQFGWNNETYVLTEQDDYTKTIETHLGCDSIVTLKLQLDYSPTFETIIGNHWVVGGSEFQYTIEQYQIETHPKSTHHTEWRLFDSEGNPFNKWEVLPFGLNNTDDKCYLYIYTFERDSIRLNVKTQSTGECECGGDEKDIWIHCGYHGVNETIDPCTVDIFPNPNDGNMTLSFDNLMGETTIKVYDIAGTLVDQLTLHNGFGHQTYTYQSDKLSPGVYFFNIINKKGSLTKKVIIID
ncbi:MAG: PKD domain-containing protein [Bacteroidales bacterium]|nr:PKD domain-containing protein [Bacteroidales bacterium]